MSIDLKLTAHAKKLFTGPEGTEQRVATAIVKVADALGVDQKTIADALNKGGQSVIEPVEVGTKAPSAEMAIFEQLSHIAPDIAEKPIVGQHTAALASKSNVRDCSRER